MVRYCTNPSCAEPNHYTLNLPLYCGFCGGKLDGSSVAKTKATVSQPVKQERVTKQPRRNLQQENVNRFKNRASQEPEDEDDGTEDIEYVPQLEKLDFEIIGTRNKMTFADLSKQDKMGFTPRPVENISQEESMRLFRQEASKSAPIEIDSEE